VSQVVQNARAYRRQLLAKLDKIEEFLMLADSLRAEAEGNDAPAEVSAAGEARGHQLSFRGNVPFDAAVLKATAS